MRRRISVIITTFNRPVLLREAVEGVLAQQCNADLEIIVIDDGSASDTESAIRPHRHKIRYVRQENVGLSAARNHALRLVTGDVIAFLDDDDVWLPFKTELQLAALERFPSAAFVHSNFFIWKPGLARRPDGIRTWFPEPFDWNVMYGESAPIQIADYARYQLPQPVYRAYCGDVYAWSVFAPMVLPSTAMIRREKLPDDLRFPEFDTTCGDWEFFARLSHEQGGGVFVAEETTLNRSHEDPWRLTRVDGIVQLRRQIALIRRVWRADHAFLAAHRADVDRTEASCLRWLARRLLKEGDRTEARATLREAQVLDPGAVRASDTLLTALTHVPFSKGAVAAIRRAARLARGGAR
jgi:glycosyltransferase involved in cell wall biosynthesis